MKKLILCSAAAAALLMSSFESKAQWGLTGNAGTNPATNFLGTTDNKAFKLKTNNVVRLTVSGAGRFGIGNAAPLSRLDILGSSTDTTPVINVLTKYSHGKDIIGINSVSNTSDTSGIGVSGEGNLAGVQGISNTFGVFGSGSYGVYGTGLTGLFGDAGTSTGTDEPTGVWGQNSGGTTGNGVFGYSTGATQNIAVWGIATDTATNIPAANVDFAGYFQGNVLAWKYYLASDARLKNNIQPLTGALEKLNKISTATYTFKRDEFPTLYLPAEKQIGFIADNLKSVFPDLVQQVQLPSKTNPRTHKVITAGGNIDVVNYMGMVPVITAAIQEQQVMLDKKDVQIDALTTKLTSLEARLAALETAHNATPSNNEKVGSTTPASAKLDQNNPNPFTQSTTIRYFIPENVNAARIIITASNGNVLKNYTVKGKGAGEITVNANELAAGIYTYSLLMDGQIIDTKSLVLTK